jgi:hypothetical protein
MVYLLTRLKQCTKYLRLGKVSYILLPVIFIFKFLKEVKTTKPKLGRGINKEINIGILNIIKK